MCNLKTNKCYKISFNYAIFQMCYCIGMNICIPTRGNYFNFGFPDEKNEEERTNSDEFILYLISVGHRDFF